MYLLVCGTMPNKLSHTGQGSILKEFSMQRITDLPYLIILPKVGILCTALAIKLYVSGFQIRIF